MNGSTKGIASAAVLLIGVIVLMLGGGYWYWQRKNSQASLPSSTQEQIIHKSSDRATKNISEPQLRGFQRAGSKIITQTKIDFNGDGVNEIIFVEGNEYASHQLVLLKYNLDHNIWEKTILDDFHASGYVPNYAKLDVVDLNGDKKQELLYRETLEGSGAILAFGFYAYVDGEVKKIQLPDSSSENMTPQGELLPYNGSSYTRITSHFLVYGYSTAEDKFLTPLPLAAIYYSFDGAQLKKVKVVKCTVVDFGPTLNQCIAVNSPSS